ncbi:hypothetical protein, partial [Effusibacillus lacus]
MSRGCDEATIPLVPIPLGSVAFGPILLALVSLVPVVINIPVGVKISPLPKQETPRYDGGVTGQKPLN